MADILLVEDDRDVAWTFKQLLMVAGYEVRVAEDGEEGLRLLREQAPDLVITDVEMPVLDGPGMAYRMFLHDKGLEDIPIVIVSGYPELKGVADDVGTPYFLSKPFNFDDLLELVGRALTEKCPPKRTTSSVRDRDR